MDDGDRGDDADGHDDGCGNYYDYDFGDDDDGDGDGGNLDDEEEDKRKCDKHTQVQDKQNRTLCSIRMSVQVERLA